MNYNNRLSSTLANNIRLDSSKEYEAEKIAGGNIIWLVNRPAGVKIYVNSMPDRSGALVLNEANRGYKWEQLGNYGDLKLYDNFYLWTEGKNINGDLIELQVSPNADIITPILGNTSDKIAAVDSVSTIGRIDSLLNVDPSVWGGFYGISNIKKIYKQQIRVVDDSGLFLNYKTEWGHITESILEVGNRADMYVFAETSLSLVMSNRNNIREDFSFNYAAAGSVWCDTGAVNTLTLKGEVSSVKVTDDTSSGELSNIRYPIGPEKSNTTSHFQLFFKKTTNPNDNIFRFYLVQNVKSDKTLFSTSGGIAPIAFVYNINFLILEI